VKKFPANLEFLNPCLVLEEADAQMAQVPNERLFVDANPNYRKLFERWCAGSFGVGYGRFIAPCEVAVNDERTRVDADFFLRVRESIFAFQTVEVLEEGRLRSDEYRSPGPTPYEPERGAMEGPGWLEAGVQRKLDKRYAGAGDLHILAYANFTTENLRFADVAQRLERFRGKFASVWVIAFDVFGSICSTRELGSTDGWRTFRTPHDWNAGV